MSLADFSFVRVAFAEAHPSLASVLELPEAVNKLIPNDKLANAGIKKRVRVELCADRNIPACLQIVLFEAAVETVTLRNSTVIDTLHLALTSDNKLVRFAPLNDDKYNLSTRPGLDANDAPALATFALKSLFAWAGPAESLAMLKAIEAHSSEQRKPATKPPRARSSNAPKPAA